MDRSMDNTKVAQRLKSARKNSKLKQKELAEIIGVTPSMISAIERGVRTPSLDVFVDILNTLDTPSDLVLQDVLKCGFKIQATVLSEKVEHLPEEEQKRIFRMLDAAIDKS